MRARVLLLARYGALGASSRVRSLQFLPYLEQQGFEVDVASLFDDDYVARLYDGRRQSWAAVAASYGKRVLKLLARGRYDVVWVEKELFPWLPAWADLSLLGGGARLLVDYDDAVFHRYDAHRRAWVRRVLGGKIDAVMRAADVVVVGNAYLGARARAAGARRVELLPTVVDTARYAPRARTPGAPFTLGWIGTPRTARYLRPLAVRHRRRPLRRARLVLVRRRERDGLPGAPRRRAAMGRAAPRADRGPGGARDPRRLRALDDLREPRHRGPHGAALTNELEGGACR
jgi:hypothetical protein